MTNSITFRPGLLPAHDEATHPRLHLAPHVTTAAAPPASVDWHSNVTAWPMYGNDQIGDCTEAMVGHVIQGASTYGEGNTVTITDADVLAAYERVSGYNPADPSTDQGAVLQDVYNDWRKTGVGGHKNLVFAQVNHNNHDEVKTAVYQFGAAGLGIVVTQSMMDAFAAGQDWVSASGPQLGGHAVPCVGYDEQGVRVVTWGRVQLMTWDCFSQCVEEAWVAVLPEWLNATGTDPEGVDLHGLGDEFASLTGQPNPFPAPTPTPVPVPVPPPAPVPPGPADDADRTFAKYAHTWIRGHHVGHNHTFAAEVAGWLTAKGL